MVYVQAGSGVDKGSGPGPNLDTAAPLPFIIHQMDEFGENGADLPLAR